MLSAMRKLFTLLIDSFVIWSRNFTLIYIFLLALFVFSIILGQAGMPTLETQWILLGVILVLIFAAIMAGWFNMVATACARFLDKPREEALKQGSPLDAITLFRAFLPGIGQFFPMIALGYGIQLGVAVILALVAQPLWAKNLPLLEKMVTLDLEQRLRFVESLSQAQLASLSEFSLILMVSMLGYGLFSLLIMLWPAFVIYYGNNAFKACWRSIVQFAKDPLWMLFLSVFFIGIKAPLNFLSLSVAPASAGQFSLAAAGVQLLGLLVEIYTAIVIFTYVYQRVGKPILKLEESSSENVTNEPPAI